MTIGKHFRNGLIMITLIMGVVACILLVDPPVLVTANMPEDRVEGVYPPPYSQAKPISTLQVGEGGYAPFSVLWVDAFRRAWLNTNHNVVSAQERPDDIFIQQTAEGYAVRIRAATKWPLVDPSLTGDWPARSQPVPHRWPIVKITFER